MELIAVDWFLRPGDLDHVGRVAVRLIAACLLGAVLGYEREEEGQSAGLRTHMLVALGAALFTVVTLEVGATPEQMTRVVQGVAVGIGFLGGGVILKLTEERRIKGLTTAANLWVSCAAGMAAGMGMLWPAVIAVVLALVVLVLLRSVEPWLRSRQKKGPRDTDGPNGM